MPARGGSKGIARKNLALVDGVPLVVRAVRSALAAAELDGVVVSTDDPEIAALARAEGARVVERPAALATDETSTEAALLHALDALGGPDPDWVVTLEPTAPLRTAELIDRCVALARERDADAVTTVVETSALVGHLGDNSAFAHTFSGQPRRRQAREPLYRESSTVYVTRTAHLRATGSVLAEPLYAVTVSEEEALDVNTPLDLLVAEALVRAREEGR